MKVGYYFISSAFIVMALLWSVYHLFMKMPEVDACYPGVLGLIGIEFIKEARRH